MDYSELLNIGIMGFSKLSSKTPNPYVTDLWKSEDPYRRVD